MNNTICLSIKPKYAEQILQGKKTVELRKVKPKNLLKGDIVLIYVTSPIQKIVGAFKVERIIEKSINELWHIVNSRSGITFDEFKSYYQNSHSGIGIEFTEVYCFSDPIGLDALKLFDFTPPQSFRYFSYDIIKNLELQEEVPFRE